MIIAPAMGDYFANLLGQLPDYTAPYGLAN